MGPSTTFTVASSPTATATAITHRSFLGSRTVTIAIGVGGLLFLAAVLFLCLQQVRRRDDSASVLWGSAGSASSDGMTSQHGTQPLVAEPSVIPNRVSHPSQHSQLSYARGSTTGFVNYSLPMPVSYHEAAAARAPVFPEWTERMVVEWTLSVKL